jgi:hypothetical protein
MPSPTIQKTAGTGGSAVVDRCQVCDAADLRPVLFLGYLPPVNHMRPIGSRPQEEPGYPAELLACGVCGLVQLGLTVDPSILFPPEYPYTSGTTKILRENFAELYTECKSLFPLDSRSLAVDVGSNDGTLLSNFKNGGHRVLGIEPTLMARLANERGITSMMAFFGEEAARRARAEHGPAAVLTATNVFAHIEDVHAIVEAILHLLDDRGVFISESHYLAELVRTLQYDTVYHEHLRYYSLSSLSKLLAMHGLEVIHARRIPTHGGSIRVYAARKGVYPARESVAAILAEERASGIASGNLGDFRDRVVRSKLELYAILADIKRKGGRIHGIGAPSRASTLVHYAGLDDGILDAVLEIKGSYKIGKFMPGTRIPVLEESALYQKQPEYALLFSWHIADELIPKIREKGFRGKFIVPLPEPRIVS